MTQTFKLVTGRAGWIYFWCDLESPYAVRADEVVRAWVGWDDPEEDGRVGEFERQPPGADDDAFTFTFTFMLGLKSRADAVPLFYDRPDDVKERLGFAGFTRELHRQLAEAIEDAAHAMKPAFGQFWPVSGDFVAAQLSKTGSPRTDKSPQVGDNLLCWTVTSAASGRSNSDTLLTADVTLVFEGNRDEWVRALYHHNGRCWHIHSINNPPGDAGFNILGLSNLIEELGRRYTPELRP